MKKNGKMTAVILAAVLVAATAGCSRNQSGEGGNVGTEALKTSGERQLNVLVEAGSPAFDVAEQTAVEFEEQTGIKVNIDAVPYSGMYDKLAAEVTSQAGLYDVACVDTVWMAGLKNGLLPLDDIVTDEMKLDFPETLVTDGTLDGTLYGLPAWANGKVLLYRTDLFEDNTEKENFKAKYGYELKVPGTWQEYLDVAEFFTRDNDKDGTIDMYGTSLSAKTGGDTVISFLEMAVQAGGTPLVLDSEQQVMVNQQAYVDALNHMKALYDAQCVPAGIFEMAAADHVKMFSEGKLAMAPVWCAMYT
ncbi:MAG: ABC transporter substrate-binding protein, partial [Coprococcus sp.]